MSIIYLVLNLIILIVNYIYIPQNIVAQSFCAISLLGLFSYFKNDERKLLFYSTLVFAIVNAYVFVIVADMTIYLFYISIAFYYVYILLKFRKSIIKNIFNKIDYYKIFLLIFILYIPLSVYLSPDKKMAIITLKNYAVMVPLCLMVIIECSNLERIKESSKVLKYVVYAIFAISFLQIFKVNLGLINHYSDFNVSAVDYPFINHIPMVFFYNPNNYSLVLTIIMIILITCILYTSRKKSIAKYSVLYMLSIFILIFTMSRTAWITLFLAMMFMMLIFMIKREKKKIIKTAAILSATFIIMFSTSKISLYKPFYGDTTSTIKSPIVTVGAKGSTNERATIIYDVLKGVFKEKHFLGFGPGNTSLYVAENENTNGIVSIHSFWFEVLGDFGILIFLLTIVYYLKLLWDILLKSLANKKPIDKYELMMGTGVFSLILLVNAPSTIINFPSYWIIFGLLTGFAVYKNRSEEK